MARKQQPAMQRTLTAPDPDALLEVWIAMAVLAVKDYETLPPGCKEHQTAAAWLDRVGLLDEHGNLDRRGYRKRGKA